MRYAATPIILLGLAGACSGHVGSTSSQATALQAAATSMQSDLTALRGKGTGMVKVTPTAEDRSGPGTMDVRGTVDVRGAAPRTSFTVLRRVDLAADGVCTSDTWLTLPPPNAQGFTTSPDGAGALPFHISRGAPFLDGVRFDVQWRLAGDDGSMLESDCFTVTVR